MKMYSGMALAAFSIAELASAHMTIWTESMYGFHQDKLQDPIGPNLNNIDQWWFHGPQARADKPAPGKVTELPAGGTVNFEIACNKAWTSFGATPTQEGSDGDACPGNYGSYHTSDDGTFDKSQVAGCALGIADVDDLSKVTMDDLRIFSTNQTCVSTKRTYFEVPKDMPGCSGDKCICAWFWQPKKGEGNFYMTGFDCKVTNVQPSARKYSQDLKDPTFCENDSNSCTKGAKKPFYVYNTPSNIKRNINNNRAGYHSAWSFPKDGAQDDIFSDELTNGQKVLLSINQPGRSSTSAPAPPPSSSAAPAGPSTVTVGPSSSSAQPSVVTITQGAPSTSSTPQPSVVTITQGAPSTSSTPQQSVVTITQGAPSPTPSVSTVTAQPAVTEYVTTTDLVYTTDVTETTIFVYAGPQVTSSSTTVQPSSSTATQPQVMTVTTIVTPTPSPTSNAPGVSYVTVTANAQQTPAAPQKPVVTVSDNKPRITTVTVQEVQPSSTAPDVRTVTVQPSSSSSAAAPLGESSTVYDTTIYVTPNASPSSSQQQVHTVTVQPTSSAQQPQVVTVTAANKAAATKKAKAMVAGVPHGRKNKRTMLDDLRRRSTLYVTVDPTAQQQPSAKTVTVQPTPSAAPTQAPQISTVYFPSVRTVTDVTTDLEYTTAVAFVTQENTEPPKTVTSIITTTEQAVTKATKGVPNSVYVVTEPITYGTLSTNYVFTYTGSGSGGATSTAEDPPLVTVTATGGGSSELPLMTASDTPVSTVTPSTSSTPQPVTVTPSTSSTPQPVTVTPSSSSAPQPVTVTPSSSSAPQPVTVTATPSPEPSTSTPAPTPAPAPSTSTPAPAPAPSSSSSGPPAIRTENPNTGPGPAPSSSSAPPPAPAPSSSAAVPPAPAPAPSSSSAPPPAPAPSSSSAPPPAPAPSSSSAPAPAPAPSSSSAPAPAPAPSSSAPPPAPSSSSGAPLFTVGLHTAIGNQRRAYGRRR